MVLYYILLPLAWLVFHIGFRVHTVGRENLRKVQTKGCIIAPNHVSAIDPVFIVISRFWGRRMLVFAKKELFEINALLTWFFRCSGALCVRGTKEELEIIDAEQNPDMARQFGIMQAPTLVITDGEHLKKYVNASNIQKYVDEEL